MAYPYSNFYWSIQRSPNREPRKMEPNHIFGLPASCRPQHTDGSTSPLPMCSKFDNHDYSPRLDKQAALLYISMLGNHCYLEDTLRSDNVISIERLVRYSTKPSKCYRALLKRVSQQPERTLQFALKFLPRTIRRPLECYAGSAFAIFHVSKSTTGSILTVYHCLFTNLKKINDRAQDL